ncbi:Oligomerization domain-containing protein [Paraphysoderma sedebokerense]|nr:Oligomerization domain-containing protein [Paraphysoderma sedebokerense]KAI9137833.1 Oligomerization domain-containing protein [Paraphysoderma sedebokerense]
MNSLHPFSRNIVQFARRLPTCRRCIISSHRFYSRQYSQTKLHTIRFNSVKCPNPSSSLSSSQLSKHTISPFSSLSIYNQAKFTSTTSTSTSEPSNPASELDETHDISWFTTPSNDSSSLSQSASTTTQLSFQSSLTLPPHFELSSYPPIETLCHILYDSHGKEIKVLDVSETCTFADYFIIVTGNSRRHIRGIVENVIQFGKRGQLVGSILNSDSRNDESSVGSEQNVTVGMEDDSHHGVTSPVNVDGIESDDWVAVDIGNIVVHVFSQEGRDNYCIDQIWENMDDKTGEYDVLEMEAEELLNQRTAAV